MESLRRVREGFGKEVYKACDLGRLPRGHLSVLNASKQDGLGVLLQALYGQVRGERGFLSVIADKPLEEQRMGKNEDRMETSRYHAALIDSDDFLNGQGNIRKKLIPGGRLVVIASKSDEQKVMERMENDYFPIRIQHEDMSDGSVLVVGDRL